MARALTNRPVELDQYEPGPGNTVESGALFTPPKGVTYSLAPEQVPPEYSTDQFNLLARYGRYESKTPVNVLGGAAPSQIVYACEFSKGDGTRYPTRFLTNKVQVYDGSTWNDVAGIVLTGSITDRIAITSFNNKLIFSNNKDGLFEIDPSVPSGSLIAAGPSCKQLTTLAGRVIASGVLGFVNRIKWSAKNDHTVWTGTGTGFEDMLSTPGGEIDQQFGVWPVSDDTGVILRASSIWGINTTGNVDVPFTFSRLVPKIGGTSRFAVVPIPGGIVFLGNDKIYRYILGQPPEDIAPQINDRVIGSILDRDGCYMALDTKFNEVALFTPSGLTKSVVYIGSLSTLGWMPLQYQFPIYSLSTGRRIQYVNVDDLVGDVDDLEGDVDDLGVSIGRPGYMFAMDDPGRHVVVNDNSLGSDSLQDITVTGSRSQHDILIASGLITSPSRLDKIAVLYVQIAYKSSVDVSGVVEYSLDQGQTWQMYSQAFLPAAITVNVVTLRYSAYADEMMLRLRAPSSATFELFGVHVYKQAGPRRGLS
jgi:hypothetical protein